MAGHHVEVELLASALILHLVDKPDARVDADALERRRVVEREPLLAAILDHDLEGDRRAVLRQSVALEPVAGLVQLGERPFGHLAVAPGAVVDRRAPAPFQDVLAHGAGKGASKARSASLAGRPVEASSDWSKKLLVRV